MSQQKTDIIDHLLGEKAATKLVAIRNRRPVTRDQAQASWEALFEPESTEFVSLKQRFAVALFVALLHENHEAASFYASKVSALEDGAQLVSVIETIAKNAQTKGPYGNYPAGPLTKENESGVEFIIAKQERDALGTTLAAALEHTHFLVFHLRDAKAERLQKLLDAGWNTTGIVTISQLVAFLSFQFRVASGLNVLASA